MRVRRVPVWAALAVCASLMATTAAIVWPLRHPPAVTLIETRLVFPDGPPLIGGPFVPACVVYVYADGSRTVQRTPVLVALLGDQRIEVTGTGAGAKECERVGEWRGPRA